MRRAQQDIPLRTKPMGDLKASSASHTICSVDRNIYLQTAYDGTDFHGWQRQGELRTVQLVMEDVIRRVVRHPINLIASGRTDAGVHAAGHVCSFVTQSELPIDRLGRAIGFRLPHDISVVAAREVHPDFNARRSALSKLYRYRIFAALRRPVEQQVHRFMYHVWTPLDVERMREAARYLVGQHDFLAMSVKRSVRSTTVREVLRCEIERHHEDIRIDVEGTGFLHHQVRIMAGTLIRVGRGDWEPQRVAQILESKDRAQAGPTAPAHGLCLQWVRYPPALLVAPCPSEEPQARGGSNREIALPDLNAQVAGVPCSDGPIDPATHE